MVVNIKIPEKNPKNQQQHLKSPSQHPALNTESNPRILKGPKDDS